MNTVLAEGNFLNEDHCLRLLAVIDFMSLMILNNDVKNLCQEKIILRNDILQMFCLARLQKEAAAKKEGCCYNPRKRIFTVVKELNLLKMKNCF